MTKIWVATRAVFRFSFWSLVFFVLATRFGGKPLDNMDTCTKQKTTDR